MDVKEPLFDFDNTFARDMEGFFLASKGQHAPSPEIKLFNTNLAHTLGLDPSTLNTEDGASILSGSTAPEGAHPLSQAYAGHQFGGFSEQLGDGRALLLGEIKAPNGRRYDVQLKGSGRTPFSRGGDGRAALGPVLREYIVGEAMHALGIPTTRALAAVTTGEHIYREGIQKSAVLTRIAASHLRVGTFQFFAARREFDKVRQLADYAINRHYPAIAESQTRYLDFLSAVAEAQAKLVSHWMLVGFIHGVMNTDNITISGETIDYGPCAFMDHFDAKTVFSFIDRGGRYAYGNQPTITQWNLARFAEALVPLLEADTQDAAIEKATEIIHGFQKTYTTQWLNGMRAKLGIYSPQEEDFALVTEMFKAMDGEKVDFTQFFRRLADAVRGDDSNVITLFSDATKAMQWLPKWHARLAQIGSDKEVIRDAMNTVNPIYIPRNNKVEEALAAAVDDDTLEPAKTLLSVLSQPFTKRDGLEAFEKPAPESSGAYQTFCGT